MFESDFKNRLWKGEIIQQARSKGRQKKGQQLQRLLPPVKVNLTVLDPGFFSPAPFNFHLPYPYSRLRTDCELALAWWAMAKELAWARICILEKLAASSAKSTSRMEDSQPRRCLHFLFPSLICAGLRLLFLLDFSFLGRIGIVPGFSQCEKNRFRFYTRTQTVR